MAAFRAAMTTLTKGEREAVLGALSPAFKAVANGGRVGNVVWDIMTAMRGPDDENIEVKERTTARLRHAAFTILQVVQAVPMSLCKCSLGRRMWIRN